MLENALEIHLEISKYRYIAFLFSWHIDIWPLRYVVSGLPFISPPLSKLLSRTHAAPIFHIAYIILLDLNASLWRPQR